MDTDACEPYSISIPCVPFFACAMQVQAKELSDSIYSNHSVNMNVNVNLCRIA